jgi:hypothetical protein
MCEVEELIPTERVALIVYELTVGGTVTTAQVAQMTGITHSGAWRMLGKLSRVLPLTEENGQWYIIALQSK